MSENYCFALEEYDLLEDSQNYHEQKGKNVPNTQDEFLR